MTGFDPFGGADVNPSLEAVKRLDGRILGNEQAIIRMLQVPVVLGECIKVVCEAIDAIKPVPQSRLIKILRKVLGRSVDMIF